MASYHCTAKIGGKGSAGKHADYISREGKYSPELTKGRSKLEDLEHAASGNMPKWAEHDAGIFWRAADEQERANGSTYRELEVALPRELNPAQRLALVEDFIAQQIGSSHAFTFAIHKPKAAIEKGDQPHCHLMYSERTLDGIARDPAQYFKRANTKNPERGGCKKASGGKTRDELKIELLTTRELWATVQNTHLKKCGYADRVDHRSLKEQGIDRQPEEHFGPLVAKKIDATDLVAHREAERELEITRHAVASIDMSAELAAQAQREAEAAREAQAAIAQAAAQLEAEQARDQAQSAHDLETAEKAKQEKEDDRVREAALDTLAKASAATGDTLAAASQIADRIGLNTADATKGAERRVSNRHIESSFNSVARAVAEQLGHTGRVIQQAVGFFSRISQSIAAAAAVVTGRAIDRAKEAAKAIAQVAPARPPVAGLEALTDSERKTVERIADLVDRFKGGDTAVWRELARQLTKHEGTTRAAALAHGRARPPQFHYPDAHQDAQRSREADAKRDVNAQAARRGMTVVPYPQVKWSAEHYTSYEIAHKKAANEVQFRDQREPRPLEGFFNKKTVAAWDTQTSALKSTLAGWEKEIGWRDTAFKTASAAREPQDAAHVARALERHTTEHAAAIAKAAPLLARYEAHKAVDTAFAGVVDRMPMPTRVAIDENKRDHYRKAPGNNIGR